MGKKGKLSPNLRRWRNNNNNNNNNNIVKILGSPKALTATLYQGISHFHALA